MPAKIYTYILLLVLLLPAPTLFAQQLNKVMDLHLSKKPLAEVLKTIGKKGSFTFSYMSNAIPEDSIVSINVDNKTVRQILDLLLGEGNYQYKEYGNYLILQYKPPGAYFYVTGVVTDKQTGQRVSNASVYERHQLISTITNNDGYYRLRLRDRYPAAAISVSKDLYNDTALLLLTAQDQEINVTISPAVRTLSTIEVTGYSTVEKTWFGRLLLSSREKAQSMNIRQFFADKPYQVSLAPSLGTHGRMSGQVVNKFSLNVLGGYTAGVDGVEIAGGFNIVKKDVDKVQVAGLLNITGGKMHGVQIAGMHNSVLDSVSGVQVAGISNIVTSTQHGVQITGGIQYVGKSANGVQVAGLVTRTEGKVEGLQLSGGFNSAGDSLHGAQIAGLFNKGAEIHGAQIAAGCNIAKGTVKGAQIAALFNKAHRVEGVQIGLVNIADSTTGYSIGLINIVKHGYHKLSMFSTDVLPLNVAWKSGSRQLYSILTAGMNFEDKASFLVGYGMGREMELRPKLSVITEFMISTLQMGRENENSQYYRLTGSLMYKPFKGVAIFGGPVFSMHFRDENTEGKPYVGPRPGAGYPGFNIGNTGRGWLGWQLGITIF
ncbi:STN and carboxypeptidase regulatory-like domain-containing protein [Chitinophaga sp. sic0106]|uniref:STN and carboxypeptidase regulatory-like domain-containing protein n=1 Tax=Chitinophaga sp. sic0106 TaxID=2854785 RepID=UPI001C474F3D|nr:STN and carboxypeptidase regulatory-like domain-containing protein [Chitinophaga sp. sic0106]MBV7529065.1 hypothetical protein [Chitinophaga sp. sic0106]